ncbi:CDPK-related protein kinase [Daucus carota subsp. sativus]|uniref:CDPK-related protein kinase n=1 Tax=Daucus carota subsp. sativus TaxID=79200 RepID=UPI0030837543
MLGTEFIVWLNQPHLEKSLLANEDIIQRLISEKKIWVEIIQKDDAKAIMGQFLKVVTFCHLQGVVHRDLIPENFLFSTTDENSQLVAKYFELSDFIRPELHDIVGSGTRSFT